MDTSCSVFRWGRGADSGDRIPQSDSFFAMEFRKRVCQKSESLLGLNLILSSCDSITVYFSLQHCSEHLWDSRIRVRRFTDAHRALHIPRNILCTIKYRSLSASKRRDLG